MRTFTLSILGILMSFSIVVAAEPECGQGEIDRDQEISVCCDFDGYCYGWNDNVKLRIEGDDVIITCQKRRHKSDRIRITDKSELYINGKKIDVADEDKELLRAFHSQAIELDKEAKIIGKEGAKIGVEGARIGASVKIGNPQEIKPVPEGTG